MLGENEVNMVGALTLKQSGTEPRQENSKRQTKDKVVLETERDRKRNCLSSCK